MAKQSLGVVNISWNGVKFPCEKGATFRQGGLVNKSLSAGSQIFYSQEPMPSRVQCNTPYLSSTSMAKIRAPQTAELQFECDTGQRYVIANAYLVEQLEITGGEGGRLTLIWEGNEAEELTA